VDGGEPSEGARPLQAPDTGAGIVCAPGQLGQFLGKLLRAARPVLVLFQGWHRPRESRRIDKPFLSPLQLPADACSPTAHMLQARLFLGGPAKRHAVAAHCARLVRQSRRTKCRN
jgi:hypothetical protein